MSDTPSPHRPAVLARFDNPPAPPSGSRCPIQMVMGGEMLSQDAACVLRRRLGIAALIAFASNCLVFIIGFANPDSSPRWLGASGLVYDLLVMLIAGGLAALLWSSRPIMPCTLRKLELLLFGTTAAFFAWLNVRVLMEPWYLDWLQPSASDRTVEQLLTLVLLVSAMRWFFLIVLYGVFIPNTWKRCAILVGIAVLTPVLITLTLGLTNDRIRPHLLTPFLLMTVVLLAGAAIAVFGSSRIHILQEEASKYRKLGQYRLLERLGSGGMGEVYLAEHVLLRRPCAIKLIHADHARDARQLTRFEREVRAMAGLTHWNAVEVFDYGHTEDGTFYYVMEYLPGQNLDSLVSVNGPLPPARVVHLLRQVCLALREAHGIGLLHRDIKPSNIIACHRGGFHDVAKLLDFGLVSDQGINNDAMKLTMQGTILGSPPFMSPEQSRGRTDLTAASDVYAVGGVGYFLLTGHPPFVRETVMETLIAHTSEAVVPPRGLRSEIPLDLEAVILRCLEKDPARRFSSAEALEKALARCDCAGDWTEERAAEWWRTHGESVSAQGPPDTDVPTTAMSPLPV